MKKNNQNGFSLVELLVVVIIIGIIAAIAIPSLLASRKAANEASAISSVRTIHSAQVTYFATTGNNTTYSPDLAGLQGAGLIDAALGAGAKSGYNFAVTSAAGTYCSQATPQAGLGTNYYGASIDGVIYKKNAALGCAAGVLTIAGATAIQ